MASFRILLFTNAALFLAAIAQDRPAVGTTAKPTGGVGVPKGDCDCYKATANSSAYFANRKFFDSGSVKNPATPAPIVGRGADAAAGYTHPYFSTSEWTDTWALQNWAAPGQGVNRVNSPNNIFIARSDDGDDDGDGVNGAPTTHLTLRTQRQADYQSTAEIESRTADYQFLTVRMLARTRGAPGAVAALFTYTEQGGTVQDADIEIRTNTQSAVVQYTNQPGADPNATRVVEMATPWTAWQEHRYDWTPGASEWYVDGARVAAIDFQTPAAPLSVLLNVWSDGGVWSGEMEVGAEAEMQIRWLDLTFNSTSPRQPERGGGACGNVCVVDDLI